MIPGQFDYIAPRSIAEVTEALSTQAGAKVLAGGMSLIPAMKGRLNEPALLVDIAHVEPLRGVFTSGWGNNKLRVGAMTTHASLINHPELAEFPIFTDTASVIADVQVRNRGTMGGSLAYADPAADWPAVFLALDGQVTLQQHKKQRTVKGEEFFVSMMTSAVQAQELLTHIDYRLEKKRAGAAYVKHRQPASGLALAGVAVALVVDRKSRIEQVSIGVTGINAVPFRARSIEGRLLGEPIPDIETLLAICAQVSEAEPMEDLHASPDYRRVLLAKIAASAITKSYSRACKR